MNAEQWLTGRRGQALAAGILCLALALVWFGVAGPVRSWFDDRDMLLEQRQALLQRMRDVAATLPALRAASANGRDRGEAGVATMLPGTSDAVAAADLQERVQRMASAAGVNLTAVETLPATSVGNWHKITLRISMNAQWPVLMELMRSIGASPIRILIDDIHFHSTTVASRPTVLPVQASMVLYGFRPAEAGTGT